MDKSDWGTQRNDEDIIIQEIPIIKIQTKFFILHFIQLMIAVLALLYINPSSFKSTFWLWTSICVFLFCILLSNLGKWTMRQPPQCYVLYLVFCFSFSLLCLVIEHRYQIQLLYLLIIMTAQSVGQVLLLFTSKVEISFQSASIAVFIGSLAITQYLLIGTLVPFLTVVIYSVFSFIWGYNNQQYITLLSFFLVFDKFGQQPFILDDKEDNGFISAVDIYQDFLSSTFKISELLRGTWIN